MSIHDNAQKVLETMTKLAENEKNDVKARLLAAQVARDIYFTLAGMETTQTMSSNLDKTLKIIKDKDKPGWLREKEEE